MRAMGRVGVGSGLELGLGLGEAMAYSSSVSLKSFSFLSHSSTRFCIGPTKREPRIVCTSTW